MTESTESLPGRKGTLEADSKKKLRMSGSDRKEEDEEERSVEEESVLAVDGERVLDRAKQEESLRDREKVQEAMFTKGQEVMKNTWKTWKTRNRKRLKSIANHRQWGIVLVALKRL